MAAGPGFLRPEARMERLSDQTEKGSNGLSSRPSSDSGECHHATEASTGDSGPSGHRGAATTHPELLQAEAAASAHLRVVPNRGAAHDGPDGPRRGARGDAARLGLPGLASGGEKPSGGHPRLRPPGKCSATAADSAPRPGTGHPKPRRSRGREPQEHPERRAHLRIFRAGWLNHVATRRCQSLWKWGFKIMPFRLGAMAASGPAAANARERVRGRAPGARTPRASALNPPAWAVRPRLEPGPRPDAVCEKEGAHPCPRWQQRQADGAG